MRPTSLMMGVAVWSLVVALGSTLVWVVIARAGEGVVSSRTVPTTTTDQPRQAPQPSTGPSSSPSTGTPPVNKPSAGSPIRKTWQGVGGEVTVECQGSEAHLINAIPDSGFVFEIDDRGPRRVRVEFERGGDGDGDGNRSRIEASCVDDTPIFEIEVDED